MTALLHRRVTLVWAALVGITLVSWWLGVRYGLDEERIAAVALMILGYVKVRLIGLHFMELRDAPRWLRLLFEAWCGAACGGVLLLFLLS
jgi:hypothetical protein